MTRARLLLLALALAGCARPQVALVPVDRVVADVPARPGVAAWAPDSHQLALARDGALEILDTESGASRTIAGVVPRFLDWAPADDLLVVDTSRGTNRLLRVDPTGARPPVEVATSAPPLAARWWVPGVSAVIVSGSLEVMSFGTTASARLHVVGAAFDSEIYTWSATLPWKVASDELLDGWLYARPRPIVETVLANDFRKPPMFAPFVVLREIDPHTRAARELPRLAGTRLTAPASWSPDGARFASTDADGGLVIVTPGADTPRDEAAPLVAVAPEPSGAFPTWNPRASAIHLGGAIVTPDGRVLQRLVKPDPGALGVWSPDGARLALLTGGRVLVLSGFALPLEAPDRLPDDAMLAVRDKLRLLGELRRGDLIDDDEYTERRQRLLDSLERP